MEETNASEIFIIKLFIDKKPVIFKFNLPQDVTADKTNSYYDEESNKFVIPEEDIPKDEIPEEN